MNAFKGLHTFSDSSLYLEAELAYLENHWEHFQNMHLKEQALSLLEKLETIISDEDRTNCFLSLLFLSIRFQKEDRTHFFLQKETEKEKSEEEDDKLEEEEEFKCHGAGLHPKREILLLLPSPYILKELLESIRHTLELIKEENLLEKDLLRVKIILLLDLLYLILFYNSQTLNDSLDTYNPFFKKLIDLLLFFVESSLERADINLRRVTAIFSLVLVIFFSEEIKESEEKILEDSKKKQMIQEISEIIEKNIFLEISKHSTNQKSEDLFKLFVTQKSSALAKYLVVGLLRALLKLATLVKSNKKNANCNYIYKIGFDANCETHLVYRYLSLLLENKLEQRRTLYRDLNPETADRKIFLFKIYNLHKPDSEVENFLEFKAQEEFQEIASNHSGFYLDSLDSLRSK